VAVALMLRFLLDPLLGSAMPFAALFAAVAFAVWVGGWPTALVAAVAGFVAAEWLFVEPRFDVRPSEAMAPVALVYGISAGVIIWLGESMRRARSAFRQATSQIRAAVAEANTREARLRFITDAAPMLISYIGADQRYRQANAAYGHWFGRQRRDVVGRTMRDVLGDQAWRAVSPYVDRALLGEEVRFESWVPYATGGPRWIQGAYVPDVGADGTVEGFVALVHDVTARKVAEAALRESEEKFRRIVETANEGIWLLDDRACVTFANQRMSELIGYGAEEMLGRAKWDFLPARDREWGHQLFERRRAGISEQIDLCFEHKTGRQVWMIMAAKPVIDEHGVFLGTLDMFTDVTERKRLEGELEDRVSELAEADRRKDAFIATLSHELRNPLAPMRNGVALLRELRPGGPEFGSVRALLERQVDQLTRLTDDLLDASRMSRDRLELRREMVELEAVVQNAVETSRPAIEAGGHALEIALPEQPVWLDADPARLAQVFTNLLNNAASYTPRGGLIRLIGTLASDRVEVVVEDSGIGIEPQHLANVFDLFSQVNTQLDRPKGGLGIGLALVRGLVELHGGTVEARSEGLGCGSAFAVTLPLPREPRASAPARPQPASSPTARRILVVDDNRDAAESLVLLLKLRGHDVREVHDGPAAVREASAFRPDAVLLDIGLPGMSGYEVAERIRGEAWSRAAVLVAVTGWGQEADKRRSREAGIDHHLTKPVDLALLDELLDPARTRTA
jgi:PAS domain S-box-containing protein